MRQRSPDRDRAGQKRRPYFRLPPAPLGLALTGLSLTGCSTLANGFLAGPAGPIALAERHEFIVVGIILFFVFAPVALLVPLFAWHYRIANTRAAYRPQWGFSWGLEVLIWIPPIGIVVLLSVLLLKYTVNLDPYHPVAGSSAQLPPLGGAPLEVQVVALDWKWLFLYPAQDVATVNDLILPVGRAIHFTLTSGTVMQSLLMPRLSGQIYAMDGMKTKLDFSVSSPGTYYGENTQYNGDGFTRDKFTIHAVTAPVFDRWVTATHAGTAKLDSNAYQQLSVQSVLDAPRQYGQIEPDLFAAIVGQKITPGYVAQHHEAANE